MYGFLSDCRRIEEIAGEIYRRLAETEGYPREIREVFRQLGMDEQQHARHLDLLLQADEREIQAQPGIGGSKIDETVELAEQLLRDVRAGGLDAEQALRMAVRLEQTFLKVHANNAVHFLNPRLADLFSRLGREDETHLQTLRNALNAWRTRRTP